MTERKPILFLDIDGVLNCSSVGMGKLDPEIVQRLRTVLETTGAEVVVSSGWRHGGIGPGSDFHIAFTATCPLILERVVGMTGYSRLGRSVEIAAWIEENAPNAHFAVVDDHDMREAFGSRMVLTNPKFGLTQRAAERLVSVLLRAPVRCRQCGKPVEAEREVYATPVCFACLPPPKPLPIRKAPA